MSELPRKIVINADDLGYTENVNRGIFEAFDRGGVSSASVMVTGRAVEDALARLDDRPELGRGIHVALTSTCPVSPPGEVPTLVDADGTFPEKSSSFFVRYLAGTIDVEEVELEVRSQIEEGLDRIPAIDHVNSHMHVHMLPSLSRLFRELAVEYGIPHVRWSRERLPVNRRSIQSGYLLRALSTPNVPNYVVITLASFLGRKPRFVSTDAFAGICNMGRMDGRTLAAFLDANDAEVTELCVHPGYYEPGFENTHETLNARRETELRGLTADSVLGRLERDYEVIRFRDLPSGAPA